MAVTLTDQAARGISHDGVPSTFPAGSILQLRSGSAPGANAVATGLLLTSYTLGSWSAAASRSTPLAGVPITITGLAAAGAGTIAGHFRLVTASDTNTLTQNDARVEGTITTTGLGGDMTMDNTSIALNQSEKINSFSVGL